MRIAVACIMETHIRAHIIKGEGKRKEEKREKKGKDTSMNV
jgi:hypothetical protein